MYHMRFKGTHFDAGLKFGRALKNSGGIKSPIFKATEEKRRFARECLPHYERFCPEILDELKGIACGLEGSFEDICETVFCIYCFGPMQCTCFAASDGGSIILGRNSDFLVSLEKLNMNCIYFAEGVYAFNGNTTSFVQMEDGINEKGFAAGLTSVYPRVIKPGINAGVLLRCMLERCDTVAGAIDLLEGAKIASAQTFTLADAKGDTAVIECNSERLCVIRPKRGESFVVSANNFISREMREYGAPSNFDNWRSDERYAVAKRALQSKKGEYSAELAREILSGKHGFMCRYDRRKNADTVWSVVYDVKNRRIFRAEGNPSRRAYKEDTRFFKR